MRYLTLPFLLFSNLLLADEMVTETITGQSLELIPDRCIVKEQGQSCQLDVSILFISKEKLNVCVRIPEQEKTLFCMNETHEFSRSMPFTTQKSFWIQVVDRLTEQPYIKERFEVLTFVPKRLRRKRSWGIL